MMIDKYKQSFQEEARELLTELESALLELDRNPRDGEVVGRAFRALHTIKGSGAMFGFDDLSAFTHNLENAFDEVRNDRLKVSAGLVNLALAALDQIKAMVEQQAVAKETATEILAKLAELTGKGGAQSAPAATAVR